MAYSEPQQSTEQNSIFERTGGPAIVTGRGQGPERTGKTAILARPYPPERTNDGAPERSRTTVRAMSRARVLLAKPEHHAASGRAAPRCRKWPRSTRTSSAPGPARPEAHHTHRTARLFAGAEGGCWRRQHRKTL